jgi:hypothetical protein
MYRFGQPYVYAQGSTQGHSSIPRVGQNRIFAPYMPVCLVISLPNIPYTHRIYMVLANPKYAWCSTRCISESTRHTCRVGQNHVYTVYIQYFWQKVYTVYIQYFWQKNHQIYGHIRCVYTVLANPTHMHCHLA